MNMTTYFAYARRAPFGGRLTQSQIDGQNAILAEWDRRFAGSLKADIRWLAYILATAFHETGGKMQPVEENLVYTTAAQIRKTWPSRFRNDAEAKPYVRNAKGLARKVYGNRPDLGNTTADDGWTYRGRGLPQITGKCLYSLFGVAASPEKALDLKTSIAITFDGMTKGFYTGKALADYFSATTDDPEGARRIVNGTDKAKLIAGYHRNFLDALTAAQDGVRKADVLPAAAKADDVPVAQSKSVFTAIGGTGAVGLAVPLVTGINNIHALIFALTLLGLAGFFGYMFLSGRWSINRSKALP